MEKMQRLFAAVELPADIRFLLAKKQTNLPGTRWTPPENLHLTLRFIGEVSQVQAAAIRSGLKTVRPEEFFLEIKGVGFFSGKPQAVLWAGVEVSENLYELHRRVNEALESHGGVKSDGGRFSPHITLGRVRRAKPESLRAFISGENTAFTAGFTVKSFTLFSSVLAPGGAVHTAEERYALESGGNRR